MASQTWDSFFGGNSDNIFKGQYGSVLVRDYDPTKSLASYTPFDSATGEFSSTLLTTDGWTDIGYLDENGLEFNPTLTTADTKAWQSRQKLRTDVTEDSEAAVITAIEQTPIIDALETNLPLASMGTIGQVGYQYTKPKVTVPVVRQVLFVAIDVTAYGLSAWCRMYPRALMIKPDKKSMQAKTEAQSKLTFESYPDHLAGFAVRTLRDGPGWRARGGTTGTTGTPVAATAGTGTVTLSFTAPTTANGPFTYNVFVDDGVVALDASKVSVGGTLSNPVLTVTGQAAGAHTYKVQAVGSNLSGSAQSAASNSVTVS